MIARMFPLRLTRFNDLYVYKMHTTHVIKKGSSMMTTQFLKLGLLWVMLTTSLAAPSMALSKFAGNYQSVEIDVVKDNGESFAIYPITQRYLKNDYRAYLEAIKGENYALRIRNHSNQRLGLVIAVDGRNIISGKKSHLKHHENMYILDPYQTQTYSGWRTSSNAIHRFYFTDMDESYAHAFGDDTAMGVIAVAIFQENKPKLRVFKQKERANSRAPAASGRSFENDSSTADQAESEAGTGFGEHASSQAYRVHFNPQRIAQTKYFYKYEWREVLCQKHIIDCGLRKNRFWPHDDYELGFAPYPPNQLK